jgi:hypothetical protein
VRFEPAFAVATRTVSMPEMNRLQIMHLIFDSREQEVSFVEKCRRLKRYARCPVSSIEPFETMRIKQAFPGFVICLSRVYA